MTSAVLYIGFIVRLASTYRLRQLAGTSAGAIAAAAGAIAEFGRQRDAAAAPFASLLAFAEALGAERFGRTRLLRLFQPAEALRPHFQLVLDALAVDWAGRSRPALVRAVVLALWRRFPVGACAGLACVVAPALLVAPTGSPWSGWVVAAVWAWVALATVVAATLASALQASVSLLVGLRKNGYGLCSGDGTDPTDPALTTALHGLYQQLAGPLQADRPVCFGDLWGKSQDKRAVDLQVITTCITLRQPMRLPGPPGHDPLRRFYYDPDAWSRLFPPGVLQAMQAHPRPGFEPFEHEGTRYLPMPEPRHLPVVVAVRLSLSFPGLLSAVPMLHVRTEAPRDPDTQARRLVARHVLFSDGGITNNCPVQLFDAPLPERPTFAVDLADALDGEAAGRLPGPLGAVAGFVASLVWTGLNWRDALQLGLPGVRERTESIAVPPHLGGLNLAMRMGDIRDLNALGEQAADRLVARFRRATALGQPNGWEVHRWTRMRATLAATARYLEALRFEPSSVGETTAEPMLPGYAVLPGNAAEQTPAFVDAGAAERAAALMADLGALSGTLQQSALRDAPRESRVTDNAPQPEPELRLSPNW